MPEGLSSTIQESVEQVLSSYFHGEMRIGEVVPLTKTGRRNQVFRCRCDGHPANAPSTIILKVSCGIRYVGHPWERRWQMYERRAGDSWRLQNESTNLDLLQQLMSVSVPRLIGSDSACRFLILEDLGTGTDLAQKLMAPDPAEATDMLLRVAKMLGVMHSDTMDCRITSKTSEAKGLPFNLRKKEARYLRSKTPDIEYFLTNGSSRTETNRLQEEIAAVIAAIENPGPFLAFTHGDPCPDNFLLVNSNTIMLDLELGGFRHAFMDAVQSRMCYPPCWCTAQLPQAILSKMDAVYRKELINKCPEAGDEKVYAHAMTDACAFWLMLSLAWHLNPAITKDEDWGLAATRRRVTSVLHCFLMASKDCDHRPYLQERALFLLNHLTKTWDITRSPSPFFPAFR